MHALVIEGHIQATGTPPDVAQRLDTGEWVLGLTDDGDLAACGWLVVTETPRPSDTDTTTWQSTVEVVDGAPMQVWVEAPLSSGPFPPDPIAELHATVAAQQATIDALLDALGGSDG